jgi:peptide/nickel transport system substrate-binding protein
MIPDPLYFGRKPKLERVVFKIIPDRNTTLTQMTTHEIDLWLPVPAAFYDRIRVVPAIKTVRQASYAFDHIDFLVQHGALRDPVVRRALRLAIDRRSILEKVGHGVGVLQETPFPPGHPMHADVPLVPYDVDAANRLLDGAGWKRGPDGIRAKGSDRLQFTFALGTGVPDRDATAEQIRQTWTAIGAGFELRHYPSPILFAQAQVGGILYSGKFDVTLYSWFTNPNGDLTNLYGCDRVPPNGQNVPRYCDRTVVDTGLNRFLASYDETVQRTASRSVQERIARDAPTIVMNAREDVFAFNDDLHGFAPNQVTAFDDLVDADI